MFDFCRGSLVGVLALIAVPAGPACDAVVVGRLASADGSVLLGHNEENALDRVLEFRKIPRQRPAADAKVDLGRGGQLDSVPETSAFLWSENPGLEYSDGYLNEWGVAVASIQCMTREDGYEALPCLTRRPRRPPCSNCVPACPARSAASTGARRAGPMSAS
ncbi:MAG: hypothetical protein MUE50_09690 [Pirellulaceae bacterium]|nr:hypothetical protein [Pirellulaceae bacterium]